MPNRLFIKVFLGFWLISVSILGSWILLANYFDELPGGQTELRKDGPPPRYLLRLIYSLENQPLSKFPGIVERASERHGIDIYLLRRDGSELLDREVPAQVMRAARQLSPSKRRAMLKSPQGQIIAHTLFRGERERMAAVIAFPEPRAVVATLGANPLLRIAIAILISGLVCYLLSRLLTRRVKLLQSTAGKLAAGDLSARIPVAASGGDEADELARQFNHMASELEQRIQGQKRLLQDVSHELRSPLARLRIALALAQEQPEPDSQYLKRIEQETERLDELSGQLLTSQSDSLTLDTHIDLVPLLQDMAADADFEGKSQDKRVALFTDLDEAVVLSHDDLLQKCFENVVRNALSHTPSGTQVTLDLRRIEGNYHLSIEDCGPGVPESELERIFDPLYRVDRNRTRETGGYGLGLSIAKRAIEQHNGRLAATNTGAGLRVSATLPVGTDATAGS